MTPELASSSLDERVLILAPTGRDSQLLQTVLHEAGIASLICSSGDDFVQALRAGAGALILAEEALSLSDKNNVLQALAEQPAWSDLAVILLSFRIGDRGQASLDENTFDNSLTLERPVTMRALVSAVRTALRARRHQYEVRWHLETLERVQDDLRHANTLKDEFLALVSHELRTPLTTIIGAGGILSRRWNTLDDESRVGLISDVSTEASRLQRLVENMLVLSKADVSGDVALEPILVQRTLPNIVQASGLASRVVLTMEEGLPPVTANATFFEQIIENLIRNAGKYGDPEFPIEVRAETRRDYVRCSIADRGQPFEVGEIEQMFQPFYRHNRTAARVSGLGLGLPVCKRLAEVQHGRIHAEPRPGGGLEIALEIPIDTLATDEV